MFRTALVLMVSTLILLAGLLLCPAPVWAADKPQILAFSKTEGFRHESISNALAALEALGNEHGFTVVATEDADAFNQSNLSSFAAVVFVMTTGDVLNVNQQSAFEGYIQAGGGFVGIHSASDTEYDWPWYGQLVGAYFASHPDQQSATLVVEDDSHPSTRGLPETFERFDEWYNFKVSPRGTVNVLLTIDESTYNGGGMGDDHPIAWYHQFDGGRSWYTALGHTGDSYSEPLFLDHLLGGILYAMALTKGQLAAIFTNGFEQQNETS